MTQTNERELVFVKEGEEYIAIRFHDFKELVNKVNEQPAWATGMKWLSKQTGGRSAEWLREKMLYPYREELEDFISYPNSSGEPWSFHVREVKNWLDKKPNFRKAHK